MLEENEIDNVNNSMQSSIVFLFSKCVVCLCHHPSPFAKWPKSGCIAVVKCRIGLVGLAVAVVIVLVCCILDHMYV